MLKAIETQYEGYRFRSRLEARWAVFLGVMGIEWEYEKEGFDLGEAGWYLPDFYLPDVWVRGKPGPCWMEVKDAEFTRRDNSAEYAKINAFALQAGVSVALVTGIPRPNTERRSDDGGWFEIIGSDEDGVIAFDSMMSFMKCHDCGLVKFEWDGGEYETCPRCGWRCAEDHCALGYAYTAAKSARFEHGAR